MANLRTVSGFLNDYLKVEDIQDDSWNGLQVEGKPEVGKIAFVLDAGIDTFKKAIEQRADMVVVHHGLFWKSSNPSYVGWRKERIELLEKNGVSLYASHLPLDKHEEVGHNVQLLRFLGARIRGEFKNSEGKNIGWIGDFRYPIKLAEIEKKLAAELNAKCIVLPFGKGEIASAAVISGGGDFAAFYAAVNKNVDLYLTGDTSEVYLAAKDAKINVIFAGHHVTEILGLRALAAMVENKLKLETVFIDVPTGL